MYNDVEGEGGRREESMIHLEETSLTVLLTQSIQSISCWRNEKTTEK